MQGPQAIETREPDPPSGGEVVDGTYLPPEHPDRKKKWAGAGASAVGIGLLLAKAKGVLLLLLNLKWVLIGGKILLSSFSLIASVWFYALFWGWAFAVAFVLLILVHELGHAVAMRAFGLPPSLPYFIPGMGAFISMKRAPASALHEGYIALAGPLCGSLGALTAYTYGVATNQPFWLAVAYTGFFLNLFNLFPVIPLDGGRIAGALSPRIWIGGLVALVVCAIAFHWWNPLLLILVVIGIPRTIAALRGQLDPAYFALSGGARAGIAVCYFGLAALLVAGMLAARVADPASTIH